MAYGTAGMWITCRVNVLVMRSETPGRWNFTVTFVPGTPIR